MIVVADDLGWNIDVPCSVCGKDVCPGAVHVWLPNKWAGNFADGLASEKEAVAEAQEMSEGRRLFCESGQNVRG